MRLWKTIKHKEDSIIELQSNVAASAEVISIGKVSVYGSIHLSDGSPFYVKYYVNDTFYGASQQEYTYIVALQFLNSIFLVGENLIRLEIYDINDVLLYEQQKTVIKNYYDYIWFFNYKQQNVVDLDFTLLNKGKLYLGLQQDNINFVLSEMSLTINVPVGQNIGEQTIKISPILSKWEPATGQIPEVWQDIEQEVTLQEGENIINLVDILISGMTVYGICITGENVKFDFNFQKCPQQYYIVYIRRPRIVYNDRATITWENVVFKYEDSFEKFELIRDGNVIFSTEDFHTRVYTDDTLELNKSYFYQLKIYVKVPNDVVWKFTQEVADLWKKTEKERIEFYAGEDLKDPGGASLEHDGEPFIGIEHLPINVNAKFTNVNNYPDYQELNDGEGFIIANEAGKNIYKEFFVDAHIDFSDRVTITKLLDQSCMDKTLAPIVEKATFVKKLGEGYMWRFKMHKRTRKLEYDEEEKA